MSQDHLNLLFAALLGVFCYFIHKLIKRYIPTNSSLSSIRLQHSSYSSLRKESLLTKGSKVISVPNEWSDFSVGPIEGFLENKNKEVSEVPIVADVLSGRSKVCFGVIIPFDPKILEALLKLDPFERYSLVTSINAVEAEDYIFSKAKSYPGSSLFKPARPSQELRSILQSKGYL